ncbi:hypothetical protein BSKO_12600 [Bryopsis sp. KO-2023]|nr:hypothetical protein BSKO_12600 [Bryopsis sp. KO-2023]
MITQRLRLTGLSAAASGRHLGVRNLRNVCGEGLRTGSRKNILFSPRTGNGRAARLSVIQPCASAEAAKLISQGVEKYNSGDRMGALSKFDAALTQSPSKKERQLAAYNSTCVHASFGDIELARFTLRDALNTGLDFEAALQDPEFLKFETSPQILIQLKRFSQSYEKSKNEVATKETPPEVKSFFDQADDVSDLLSTEITDMDTSIWGIVRRVLILLVIGVVMFIVLFYAGLEYAFPK